MKIPPIYTITPEMLQLIAQIDAHRLYFLSNPPQKLLHEKIQRVSLLKSSLFSARIEGNTLQLDTVETTSEIEKKREVFNILRAIKHIDTFHSDIHINKNTLKKVHSFVMHDITGDAGNFRKDVSAIFNQAGVAVYLPPPPLKIAEYLDQMLQYINSDTEKFPLITAFITHLIYEKIHPFLDGNGRVGRLLIFAVLKVKGYDMGIYIPFEEYLDSHKEEYYYYLDIGLNNTEDYLLFMLQSFLAQVESTKKLLEYESKKKETLFLPPRQEELYYLIKDHQTISFDALRRRFLKIPERTLRYDLKKLQDEGYIIKIGKTRGSYYKLNVI